MLNKIKKTIINTKFNRAQNKRFASVLGQNFDLEDNLQGKKFSKEDNSKILKNSIVFGIIVAACFWLITTGLEAQASKLDRKLEKQEQEQFYNIIKSTYNQ